MKYLDRFSHDTNQITRIVIYTGIALVLLVISFGTYYYSDRYVPPVEQVSPNQKTIKELEAEIRKDPQNADLRLTLAEAYLGVQNYDAAIQQAQEVIKNYPEKDGALFILGFSHASLQQFDQAIVPLTEFVKVREASEMAATDQVLETALYFLGESYIQTGKPQDAIAPLTRALEINQTDADAMYKLGFAYTQTGQHNEALVYYERAIQFVPNFAEAYSGMSQSYDALGQTDKAAYARGMLAYSIDDVETARQELEQTVIKMPDYAPAFVGLALTYEKLGDLAKAKVTVQTALILDPNNFLAQQLLGRIETAQ
jgi:tetratricopeptide (TPR) repeat protein